MAAETTRRESGGERRHRWRDAWALLFGALLVAATVGCGGGGGGRVVVLGLDGLDPDAVELLASEGKLPNLARIAAEGAFGRLASSEPRLSPVLWTTIATGRTPSEHGIGHFVAVNSRGEELPVTSGMRRVRAVWGIASDAGRTVGVVGWWGTWPAERVNGAVVSDHTCYHFLFRQGESGGRTAEGLTYPPELAGAITPLVRRPGDIGWTELSRFARVGRDEVDRPYDAGDELSQLRWALASGDSYGRIGLHLWQSLDPDLLMVYVEATDSVSHLFGHLFRADGLAGELAEQQLRFGRTVEEVYAWADELVGRYLAALDERTTLIVLSDHGFALGTLPDDPTVTRSMRRVSERFHREHGVIALCGRGVRRGARVEGATQLDVTPTLLALLGLPAARDMPGRVLAEALTTTERPQVASYENAGGVPDATPAASAVDPQILAHLRALGYLDERAGSPDGARTLAALDFQAGRYAEAVAAYEELVRANPVDAGLRASLAGALGALGRYDEAGRAADEAIRLDPLSFEAYHNRAVVLERQGRMEEAVASYRTALRCRPDYEPSRAALLRLTGSGEVDPPRDAREGHALELAEQARQASLRGDYAGAMRLLDEAGRLAPDYVVVHRYRSNVAYFSGDLDAAAAALERALALDPGNALYRTNLERLRQGRDGAAAATPSSSP